MALAPASASAGRGTVDLGLDYASFAQVDGGNFGSRLRLVSMPACAVTTPKVAACRVQTPLKSVNDAATQDVSAQVTLGSPSMVVAAVSTPSTGDGGGAGGQYGATSLKPSGSWSAGGSSGAFTYSYPLTIPSAASSLTPSVDLSYDSASVDGQTSSTQAQSSWVGDGWSTADSFIEQSFVSCSDSPEGTASPVSTGDMCYDGPVLTMSLDGATTALIWDSTKSVWRAQNDSGDVITQVTGSNNGSGTYNTSYWTVT